MARLVPGLTLFLLLASACSEAPFTWLDATARLSLYESPGGSLTEASAPELWNQLLDAHYTRAAIEFHKVLENYSTGTKVPSALYKLGLSLLELKSVGQAKKYLQELVDKYPHTQEAELASERLSKIKD